MLFEENQTIGKADDGTAATDSAHYGNQRIRVTQSQHINIVGDDEKNRNKCDDTELFDNRPRRGTRRSRRTRASIQFIIRYPEEEHQGGLVESVIDLHGIVVVTAHEIFVIQAGASADKDG